jgi:hypothetical protein
MKFTGNDTIDYVMQRENLPDDWVWLKLSIESGEPRRLEGAVVPSGMKATSKVIRSTRKAFFATDAEVKSWVKKMDAEGKRCHMCGGTGQLLVRASVEGAEYRACPKCQTLEER